MKTYTKEQVNKKYKDIYIDVYKNFDGLYEVRTTFKEIHENTTLGQDVGTELAYRR